MQIGVMYTRIIDSVMTKGLRSFISDYPMARGYLFYGGERRMNLEGIDALPLSLAMPGLVDILKPSGKVDHAHRI